ncbi:MAG: signal recognition particle-docking protein FtsY, partial [Alcaligenaceae bacterium]|nr:signal recognition particle-docking protein FtsY [Alcaligenaceae bacterium]
MFRFFRRKKSKEENKVSKDSDVVQDTGQLEELSDKAEEAQAIVEVPVVEPAVVEVAQPESLVSEPESEAEPQPVVQTQPEFESKPEPVVSEAAEGIQVEEPVVITEAEEKAELLAEELTTAPETPEPQEVIPVAESSQEAVAVEPLAKTSWMQRLRKGLSRTGSN